MILDVQLTTDQTFNTTFTETRSVIDTTVSKPTGENGLSAYEIAVANGFEGSESAWLASLVGPPGPKGETGATGAQGPAGEKGEDGVDGYTPVKGEDYFTEAEKTEMENNVSTEIEAELNAALGEIITLQEDLMTPDGDEVEY